MGEVSTIGLDIAKSVFQVHGVDAAGQVVIRRQLKRRYVTLVPTSSSPKEPSALSVVHRVEQPGLPADGDRHCCKRRVPDTERALRIGSKPFNSNGLEVTEAYVRYLGQERTRGPEILGRGGTGRRGVRRERTIYGPRRMAMVEKRGSKNELKPGNLYQGCIFAWNAHREGKTIQTIRFDAKKGLYDVHE